MIQQSAIYQDLYSLSRKYVRYGNGVVSMSKILLVLLIMFVWISNSTSSVAQQVSGQQVRGQQLSGQQLQNGQSTDLNFSFPDTLQRQYVDDYFYVDLLLNGTEDSLTGGSVTFTFDPSIVRYEGVSFGEIGRASCRERV